MKISFTAGTVTAVATDTLLLPVTEYKRLDDAELKKLDRAVDGALTAMLKSEEFTGREGQLTALLKPKGYHARKIILVGLGDKNKLNADTYRRAMGRASRVRPLVTAKTTALYLGTDDHPDYHQACIEGFLLGRYRNLDYKTGGDAENPNKLTSMTFVVGSKTHLKAVEQAVTRGRIIAEGTLMIRDLAAAPGNFLTPTIYADKARKLARQYKFACQVLDQAAIRKEKMGAFLSVSRGSDQPPKFLILRYNGAAAKQTPIVLVGKGITFDSGGISLKSGLNMHEMKQDMTGSAVVLATIVTAARLKVRQNLVGLIPACENMPSGGATKPGDIITSRKGKTIEIINTDAEGRLILADALDYANKFKPQAVIDIATLTGASLYVLGYAGAPILGNNEELLGRIRQAADATAELVWPMPIWDEHRDNMKSDYADLRNSGGKPAGTICAAAFLENFIGNWPWVHIDIAYMDLEFKGRPYIPKGASGYGLRLLIELLSSWKKI